MEILALCDVNHAERKSFCKSCIGLQYPLPEAIEPAARALGCLDLGVRVLHLEEGSYTVPHPLQSFIT